MADDRMKNDNLDRNMGGAGQNKEDYGRQQSPGRHQQDDRQTGQRGTGESQQGQQPNEPRHVKDDFGTAGKKGVGQGGQNRDNL
jgi:hypothetical protein